MRLLRRLFGIGLTASLISFLSSSRGSEGLIDDLELPPPNFSVETRGPVHEAFAQPNEGKLEVSVPVDKAPPPTLPERPPEQRPDNPNLTWIPGYWAWDSERNDFVWVSGTFRDPPPGRRWVPGYWASTPGGWRWAPGFWAGENQPDLHYTPAPPALLADGAAAPAPDQNSAYIPGHWSYNEAESRFVWQPGYWSQYRDNRVWVNAQYYWTPNGYVYCDGYWDYPLDNRGVLFAPAYFPTPLWNDPNWFYQPSFVVPIGSFLNAGFYRPGYGHYYFGNYYGNQYAGLGYRPWWGLGNNSLYNHQRWQNRNNPQWSAQQQQLFANRQTGKAAAPPATFAQQQALLAKSPSAQPMVTPLKQFVPANGKMTPNVNVAGQNLQIRHTHDVAKVRSTMETPSKGMSSSAQGLHSTIVKLPPAMPHVRPLGAPSSASLAGIPTSASHNTAVRNPAAAGAPRLGLNGSGHQPTLLNHSPSGLNGASPNVSHPAAVRPANSAPAIHQGPSTNQIHANSSTASLPRIVNSAPHPVIHPTPHAVAMPNHVSMSPRGFSPSVGRAPIHMGAPAHMGGMPHMGSMHMGGMHTGGGHVGGHR